RRRRLFRKPHNGPGLHQRKHLSRLISFKPWHAPSHARAEGALTLFDDSPDEDHMRNHPKRRSRTLWLDELGRRTLLTVYALSSIPALSSLPGAKASIYLDFVGDYVSSWGSYSNITTPAFDQDGNPTTFSDGELASITNIWGRVAEDYAPFNLNVTTVPPP